MSCSCHGWGLFLSWMGFVDVMVLGEIGWCHGWVLSLFLFKGALGGGGHRSNGGTCGGIGGER